MEKRAHYMWYGHASSEGGPVLVADVESYASWQGSEEVWADDAVYRVHSYGPLIARLQPRFQPSGADQWHQFQCVQGIEASRAYVREMRAAAEQLEPAGNGSPRGRRARRAAASPPRSRLVYETSITCTAR